MSRENRYRIDYISQIDGSVKSCYTIGDVEKDEKLGICERKGIEVVGCVKLYPFSTEKHQHDFMLISNRCFNKMWSMESGETEWDDSEYDRLLALREEADSLFGLPLPVAWVDGKTYAKCKELSMMASEFRVESCVNAGRYDLIQYC